MGDRGGGEGGAIGLVAWIEEGSYGSGVGLGQPGWEGGAAAGEEVGVLCALGSIVEWALEKEVGGILGGGGAVRAASRGRRRRPAWLGGVGVDEGDGALPGVRTHGTQLPAPGALRRLRTSRVGSSLTLALLCIGRGGGGPTPLNSQELRAGAEECTAGVVGCTGWGCWWPRCRGWSRCTQHPPTHPSPEWSAPSCSRSWMTEGCSGPWIDRDAWVPG